VLDLFVDLFGQLKQYDGTKFNPLGEGGLADLKKSMTESAAVMESFKEKATEFNKVVIDQASKQAQNKKSTDETTLAVQQYGRILDQTAQTQAKNNALSSNAAENLAIEKEQLKQRNAELANSVRYLVAETGSINEAKAAVAQLIQQRNSLNAADEANSETIKNINAAIDRNNEFIRLNSSLLEKQKINIGNYNGAVTILQEGLAGIGAKLAAFAASGDQASEAFQKLTLEQEVLRVLLEKQTAGFTSVTQEVRATKNALDTLAVAGLKNTETFEQLNAVYETSRQKINELHTEQKILTSETPTLTALTSAARGLGGAYALGAGASALFAEGNEKVEKELNKLVAIMTFLQGLEEAVRAVKERGAIATALEAAASKALVAARQIEVAIFGESIAATEAETVAKNVNTEAAVVNTEAVEANAAGVEINTVAMEGTVAATEGATAATIGFRTALISTGIGALIIGIIYGITKLVGVISDWIGEDERAEKAQKAVTASTAELLGTIKELNEAYKEFGKERIDDLVRQGNLQKAAGQNQFIQLENERKVNEARLALAKKLVDQKKFDQTTLDTLNAKQIDALEITKGYEEDLRQAKKELGEEDSKQNKKRVEALEKLVEQSKADTKNIITEYNIVKDALKDVADSESAVNDNRAQTAKAAADELARIQADAAQRRYENATASNARILDLETSTEKERIGAIKSNYAAEVSLAGSQVAAIQKLVESGVLTEQDGADQIANIQNALNLKYKTSLDEQVKIRLDYNDRLLNAQNAINKNQNEGQAAIEEAITKDVQQELDTRLIALKSSIADKTKIIVDDYYLQLKLAQEHGKTQEEIDLLASDRDKALVELTASTQKEIYDITVSYGDRRLKAIQDQNKTVDSSGKITEGYNAQTEALNAALVSQSISYTKYVNEKRKLDEKYIADKDAADVADDQKRLENLRDYEFKQLNIKLFFAEKELDAAKAGGDDKEISNAQAKVNALRDAKIKAAGEDVALNKKLNDDKYKQDADAAKKSLDAEKTLYSLKKELEHKSFDLAVEFVDAAYENRINQIQSEIDLNDKKSQKEIEAVQRSTLSQRDQAAEIIILQANQQAKDTELKNQQKQEKIKEAKFDRDVAAAKAIWAGAEAEIAAIGEYAGTPYAFAIAAVIAAITAVNVASIYARPIPTYAMGTEDHPGGFGIVGEGKHKELVSIPGQAPFVVDSATLLDMPAHTRVLPLTSENMVMDLGGTAMSRGAAMAAAWPDPSRNDWEIAKWTTGQMVRALKKSQRKITNSIHIHLQDDSEWISKKITGKR
jgi:hypothetical protein